MDKSMLELRRQMLEAALLIQERLEGLSEADLNKPIMWSGIQRNVRFMMHRLAAHSQDHALQIRKNRQAIGAPASEAQNILAQFLDADAELLGETIGLGDAQYLRSPAEGEWSTTEVLEHVLKIENRYLEQIEAALAEAAKSQA